MTRKEFTKTGCLACLGLMAGLPLLQSCGAGLPVVRTPAANNRLQVLATEVFAKNPDFALLRANELDYDVLLYRHEGQLQAALMRCTHHDEPLSASPAGIYCNAHGSRFNWEGKPINGPAQAPLTRYRVVQEGNTITIYLA